MPFHEAILRWQNTLIRRPSLLFEDCITGLSATLGCAFWLARAKRRVAGAACPRPESRVAPRPVSLGIHDTAPLCSP